MSASAANNHVKTNLFSVKLYITIVFCNFQSLEINKSILK